MIPPMNVRMTLHACRLLAGTILILLVIAGCSAYRPIEIAFTRLPGPISGRDILEAELRFGPLEADLWAAIDAAESDYLDAYRRWRTDATASIARLLRGRPWTIASQDPRTLLQMEGRARQALAELVVIDEEFWATLEAIVAGSAWASVDPEVRGADPMSWLRTRRAMERWLAVVESGGGRPPDLRRRLEPEAPGVFLPPAEERIVSDFERRMVPVLERLANAEWSLLRRERLLEAEEPDPAERLDDAAVEAIAMERVARARASIAAAMQELLRLQDQAVAAVAAIRPRTDAVLLELSFLGDAVGAGGALGGVDVAAAFESALLARFSGRENPGQATVMLGLLVAMASRDHPALAAEERDVLLDLGISLLEQRRARLRQAFELQFAASSPGRLAGGSRSDQVRRDAAARAIEAIRGIDLAAAILVEERIPRERLAELVAAAGDVRLVDGIEAISRADLLGAAGSSRSSAPRAPLPRLPPIDRPLEVAELPRGPSILEDGDGRSWLRGRVIALASLDAAAVALLDQVVEDGREPREALVRRCRERFEALVDAARLDLEALERGRSGEEGEATADARPDPAAVAAVFERHQPIVLKGFLAMVAEVEADDLRLIDDLAAALGDAWPSGLSSLLRLAVVESIGQGMSSEVVGRDEVLGGAPISAARLALALPLDADQLAAVGLLAEEVRPPLRDALLAQERASFAAAVAGLRIGLGASEPDEAGYPRRETRMFATARAEVLRTQGAFLRSVEDLVPGSRPSLREAELAMRWSGVWTWALEMRTLLQATAEVDEPARDAWRRWREDLADAASPCLAGTLEEPPPFAGAVSSGSMVEQRLRSDPRLFSAAVEYYLGVVRALRRAAEGLDEVDPERAEALRAAILRLPGAAWGGGRWWE